MQFIHLRQCFKENPIRVKAIAKLNEHGADISTSGLIDFGNQNVQPLILALNAPEGQNLKHLGHWEELNAPQYGSQKISKPK